MSVYYAKSGGSNPLGILGTLLSIVPGMAPVGAAIGAAGALAKGNPAGAIPSLVNMSKTGQATPATATSSSPATSFTGYQPANDNKYLEWMKQYNTSGGAR